MMKSNYLISAAALLCLVGFGPFSWFSGSSTTQPLGASSIGTSIGSSGWMSDEVRAISSQASNLSPKVLKLSLTAYLKARQKGLDSKGVLTIIDYSKPSSERRLWVVDLNKEKVLFNTWVAHGKNSGQLNATSFSDQNGSLKSSLGVFLTASTYVGGDGYSLRLQGLEPGINDNAYRRDVVIHGAWYVSQSVAEKYGQLGRSWGCPAVDEHLAKPIIDTIKNRTLVVAYYPDRNWLRNSTFLAG